jgi:type IV secretory pathway component VirB8
MAQGKTMADPQETREEKEARWATQRAARDQEQHASQALRSRQTARRWVIVGVIVLIVAVIAIVMLLSRAPSGM